MTASKSEATGVARPAIPETELSAGFWEGVREGRLVIQRCLACRTLRHYPQPMCPVCRALGFDWAPVSGQGTIYSYTVAHRAFHPAWQGHVPYAIATIELDEGVRLVCDLLGTPPEQVAIGARVEVYFEEMPGQGTMPRFRLTGATDGAHDARGANPREAGTKEGR